MSKFLSARLERPNATLGACAAPNVALGAWDAPNVALGACDAPNATLGRFAIGHDEHDETEEVA
ncbi:hypothetical protein ACFORO_25495 [Amycolatopsis halotolerans]|uniref:Uncharacterized protein n=1 Tax=Amycolatopsis halotolerans TaxID=330083 RepID=A0ABV7QNP7_9PSEU